MLKAADLDKILDDGCGDAGYNDPVPVDAADEKPAPPPKRSPVASGARRPVLGATAPPPKDSTVEDYEMAQALDEAARKAGFATAEEYSKHLESTMAPDPGQYEKEMNQMQMAPGIKKAPAYMPPGAYPGDKTHVDAPAPEPLPVDDGAQHTVSHTFIKQSDKRGNRPQVGQRVTYTLGDVAVGGSVRVDDLGSGLLPWGVEVTLQRMKAGDIVEVTATGEYTVSDTEVPQASAECKWRLELEAIEGRATDKFGLDAGERVAAANELRLRGNELFRRKRLHRALHYYEQGSKYMDVLEAEDMGVPGMKKDKTAAERNQRIWKCQQPLLLNWALILMRLGRWAEAERKCTEVLMDIEKECVKALYRRGVCNMNLGSPMQARKDLWRAAELDQSIVPEVERHMLRVDQMLRDLDEEDKPLAQKIVGGFLQEADARSDQHPAQISTADAETVGAPPIMTALERQADAARNSEIDEETYCRQREAIYNQFLRGQGPLPAKTED